MAPSTWAYWAGLLSRAREIHVDTDHSELMGPRRPQYVYHNERLGLYFGRYNAAGDDVDYKYDYRNDRKPTR